MPIGCAQIDKHPTSTVQPHSTPRSLAVECSQNTPVSPKTTVFMADSEVSYRTPLPHSRRHSRRSTGNINFSHLSLSPLTSASITEQDFNRKDGKRRSGSYIQGLSAPTTPGILSRNHSFTSQRKTYSELPKSKSSSQLTIPHSRSASNQWLQRTGAALTSETRESKGQSWLTSRASSTSLIREGEDDECSIYYGADDEFSPVTPRRRLSKSFSGEFHVDGLEALEGSGLKRRECEFEFMGGEDGEEGEEYMDIPRGFGLGQFVDRLIGWSVFADDDTDSDESLDGYEEERRSVKARKERARVEASGDQNIREQQRRLRDEGEGWQDPGWIFNIASQILL